MNDLADLTGEWDYSTLPDNVKLGEGCFIERRLSFKRYRSKRPVGLSLGRNVKVYTHSEFGIEPEGSVEIGDDSVLVGAIFMCESSIVLGERVLVSYHVTIADSDFHPVNPELRRLDAIANAPGENRANRPPSEARPVVIDDDVWIGIGAIILKGVRIGKGARIGAGAVVTRDVAAGACVAGNPARVVPGPL